MKEYIGIDIGGTKCAVVRGNEKGQILEKFRFITKDHATTLQELFKTVQRLWSEQIVAIGVSCGGPLDSKKGIILGPPNLPGWDYVPITSRLTQQFHVPAYLENDANACAIAEWRFGAGQGCENMIFLTFGTGLGAGLIFNGKLYQGASGMAGEVGHIRLFEHGHMGFGKAGSYEGYCSGGGIAQYGLGSAEKLSELAVAGDAAAIKIWEQTGHYLGRLIAILIDILNPERIVIGSIFMRSGQFMTETMYQTLEAETLSASQKVCTIVPAGLGEALGDVAALCVAMHICT